MSARFTPTGRTSLSNGTIAYLSDTLNVGLLKLDGTLTDTGIKAITGVTNANPAVITVASTSGWSTGDVVVVRGVVGTTSVNQAAVLQVIDGTTCSLKTPDGLNVQGNGAYVSGGCIINLTVGDDWADVDSALQGTVSALANKAVLTDGVIDADDASIDPWTGTAHAWMLHEASGKNLLFNDGKVQVTVAADAASSATTLWVQVLDAPIPSGTAMAFSNGVTATTSADAAMGARSIAVNALSGAIAAGHTADVAATNNGFPYTAAGTGSTLEFSSGATRIGQY